MKFVVELYNQKTEEYEAYAVVDGRAKINHVETEEADSANEGGLKLPPGYVIESVDFVSEVPGSFILIRGAIYHPAEESQNVLKQTRATEILCEQGLLK